MFLATCGHVVYIARQVDWKHLRSRAQFIKHLVGKERPRRRFCPRTFPDASRLLKSLLLADRVLCGLRKRSLLILEKRTTNLKFKESARNIAAPYHEADCLLFVSRTPCSS